MANKKKQLPAKDDPSAVDQHTTSWLRAEAIVKAINDNLPEGKSRIAPIPKDYVFKKMDREVVSVAFHEAFKLIGGLPAFAAWADRNQEKFYNLYSKLLPSETQTPMAALQFNFTTAIPETPQDRIIIDEAGRVVEAEIVEDEDLPE